MKTVFNTSLDNNPLTLDLYLFEKGERPDYYYHPEDCLGTLIITHERLVKVIQIVDEDTVVLAIDHGDDTEIELEPKLLMKWSDLMKQDFSSATEQLEFVADVKPHRHLSLVR